MWNFITDNLTWIFSGIGVLIISLFVNKEYIKRKKISINQKTSGQNYFAKKIAIHNSGLTAKDVIDIANSAFTQNFPILQEIAKKEVEKNRDSFIKMLDNRISERLSEKEIDKFIQPGIQLALKDAIIAASVKDDEETRIILSNLIISRIKTDDNDFDRIIYDEAIKSLSHLTKNHIFLLTLMEIITSFIYSIIPNVDKKIDLVKLTDYVDIDIQIKNIDIEHCKSFGIINSTFPYEWDLEYLNNNSQNKEIQSLILKVREILEKLKILNLQKISISPIGRAIAKENISNLIGKNIPDNRDTSLKLSDLRVKNLDAEGEVSAYNVGLK